MQEGEAAKAARQMLSDLMDERRWRIPQLADALGISVDIVRRWQQGKSRMQIDDLVAVARLKGADLNELFGLKPGKAQGGGGDVEAIIDRKLEKVFGRLMLAMGSAIGTESEDGGSGEPEPASAARKRRGSA
jgi:transcriptional regulator with XRE-family HTH domain